MWKTQVTLSQTPFTGRWFKSKTCYFETVCFHYFPYNFWVDSPSPSLWDTPGWLLPSVQMQVSKWHQCKLPGSPGSVQTVPRWERTPGSSLCWNSDAGKPFVRTHSLAFPSLCNRGLRFVLKLQRKVCTEGDFLQSPWWKMGSRSLFFPFESERPLLPGPQSAPGCWWDQSAPSPFPACLWQPGAENGADLCCICLPSRGKAKAQYSPKEEQCETWGTGLAFRVPAINSCASYIPQRPLDKSHNLTVPLFPSIKSG